MPTTPAAHTKGVPIHLNPELVIRIDALKDPLIPRATFVKDLLDKALRTLEAQPARTTAGGAG